MRHGPRRTGAPMTDATRRARALAQRLFEHAVTAVDAGQAVSRASALVEPALAGPTPPRRVLGLSIGKAARPMARAIAALCGPRLERGFVLVNEGYATGAPADRFEEHQTGHPLPDRRSVEATGRVLESLATVRSDTLLVAGISGGGSAALAAPAAGLELDDKRALVAHLLAAGTPIDELNLVRQHLSRVKGGRLARLVWPARTIALVVSDVPGDRIDLVASGPLSPAVADWPAVRDVFAARLAPDDVPPRVSRLLADGLAGRIEPPPGPGDRVFETVRVWIVARNDDALDAAELSADRLGLHVVRDPAPAAGDPADWARGFVRRLRDLPRPACLLAGGELVSRPGPRAGRGGPCHEAALAAAEAIAGEDGLAVLAADTDGYDGNADAAGALVDGATCGRIRHAGLDPARHLERHDAATALDRAGALLRPGATGTNVMQIFCGVALPAPARE
ncbi:MAG: DUF4147 domain-containing protein [Acidobacteria bacterium]|nr:MAG: DUF4147 domain-containing protein [Acidobacteriota bacterium]